MTNICNNCAAMPPHAFFCSTIGFTENWQKKLQNHKKQPCIAKTFRSQKYGIEYIKDYIECT
jgi:hypothetical protein